VGKMEQKSAEAKGDKILWYGGFSEGGGIR